MYISTIFEKLKLLTNIFPSVCFMYLTGTDILSFVRFTDLDFGFKNLWGDVWQNTDMYNIICYTCHYFSGLLHYIIIIFESNK